MVAGSILPVAIHNNKLYFLFGKENPMEDSSKGFSDFGGRADGKETPFDAAMREGGEELTGFLGDEKAVRKLIKKNGGHYTLSHDTYHVHMFKLDYDENLPKYYNQNHEFLWNRMDKKLLNDTKLFEKIEIGWFSISDMKRRKKEFRNFYQAIVDKLIKDESNIKDFIGSRKIRGGFGMTVEYPHMMEQPSLMSNQVMKEVVINNGRVVKNININAFQRRDRDHNDVLIQGRNNNMPFLITNMGMPRQDIHSMNDSNRHVHFSKPLKNYVPTPYIKVKTIKRIKKSKKTKTIRKKSALSTGNPVNL